MISKSDFEHLFETYYSGLYALAVRYVISQDTASDIVQEVYCALWSKRKDTIIIQNPESYLYQSVKNMCLNHIKHTNVHNKFEEAIQKEHSNTSVSDFFETEDFVEHSMEKYVMGELLKLPEDVRELVLMNKVERVTAKKIAEMKNLSPRTVEGKIGRAIKKIKENFKSNKLTISLLISFLLK